MQYPTDKQLSWISHYILKEHISELAPYTYAGTSGITINAPLIGADRWLQDNISRETASDVIDLWRKGHEPEAWRQLTHLGIPTKDEPVCEGCKKRISHKDMKTFRQSFFIEKDRIWHVECYDLLPNPSSKTL